jgi:CBS domain-containing protein
MQVDVLTVDEEMPVGRLIDLMTAAHVHAAPVVSPEGVLIGMVSQEDVLVGGLGLGRGSDGDDLKVEDIMTSPAMSVAVESDLVAAARMMWRFRIHHLPVVDEDERVIGILSSIDFCRHVAGDRPDPRDEGGGEGDVG